LNYDYLTERGERKEKISSAGKSKDCSGRKKGVFNKTRKGRDYAAAPLTLLGPL